MQEAVFEKHDQLRKFRPAQLIYIFYRRLAEQGSRVTWLWLKDKIQQRTHGFSLPEVSRVEPLLYVGGQPRRRGLAHMQRLGITASVNMREEVDDARRGVALEHYLWLPTTDDRPPTLEMLTRGVAFITAHIAAGRGVYIHCAAGVGRAPTMAAAYLVSKGLTPSLAWERIRRVRPFIRPTPCQLVIVEDFARQVPL
ncbi:MAG TPA: dual specificity protein phosphatase [Anaerolineae bacterium]|nr:dual specificity protein phosphatase [Anaerolineae bacterium]